MPRSCHLSIKDCDSFYRIRTTLVCWKTKFLQHELTSQSSGIHFSSRRYYRKNPTFASKCLSDGLFSLRVERSVELTCPKLSCSTLLAMKDGMKGTLPLELNELIKLSLSCRKWVKGKADKWVEEVKKAWSGTILWPIPLSRLYASSSPPPTVYSPSATAYCPLPSYLVSLFPGLHSLSSGIGLSFGCTLLIFIL